MVSLSSQSKKLGEKMSNMQSWKQNVGSIIDYAERIFPEVEIVTRSLSGEIVKSNYGQVAKRAKKLGSALESYGIKHGQNVGSLALNTYRNMEMYYGISGMVTVIRIQLTFVCIQSKLSILLIMQKTE